MDDKYRTKWSREETILALDLYWRTPFSKITKTNKDIVELAGVIGRTPSSVGLKMSNLAAHDPELKKRNIKGMQNGSKLDKEIFEEFATDLGELHYQANLLLAKFKNTDLCSMNPELELEKIPKGADVLVETKARLGQYYFRLSVLNAYNNACCITGMKMPELLIASHIKPWNVSDPKTEKTNPKNGLCLNALHDKAFDRGLITIDKDYRIIISKKLIDINMDDETREWFYSYSKQRIRLSEKVLPGQDFIEYHNDVIFQG